MLTVTQYEARENEMISQLPNRVVEMVNPVVFQTEGYPTRVRDESELWKFLDVMHETRFERDFAGLIGGGITEAEFALIRKVAQLAHSFSEEYFSRSLTTRGSLLRAVNVFRHITDAFCDKPARIFEVGPGSGYLGCLLILSGWSYAATDITQAFYLLQNRLWNYATNGKLWDLAEDGVRDRDLSPAHPVHVPWWEFYQFLGAKVPLVDVVTCNHALAEMHPNSLAYTLRVAREMLKGDGTKLFAFEGWGFEKFIPRSRITELFYRFGFRLVHNDDEIVVFCPADNACANPSFGLPSRPPIKEWLKDELKRRLGIPFGSARFSPPRTFLKGNVICQRLLEARNRRSSQVSINLERVNEFYKELLASDDYRTPDERFLDQIDRTY